MPTAPFYDLEGQIAIDLPGARALFSTVSWGDVRETEQQIAARLELRIARPRQVHGTTVIALDDVTPGGITADADGVATATVGVAPTVICADCVPVVIAAGGAVAAVHAGWKGLRDGVIAEAVSAVRWLAGEHDGSGHVALTVAIGPCAGACCYEVSDELHEVFAEHGQDFRNGRNLDLNAITRAQLAQAGVETVHDLELCTICSDPALLFSHRRDHGDTGRQAALIWLS